MNYGLRHIPSAHQQKPPLAMPHAIAHPIDKLVLIGATELHDMSRINMCLMLITYIPLFETRAVGY